MSSKQVQRSNSVNRKTGSFYTPVYIAEHIARNSLNAWFSDKSGIDLSDKESIYKIEEKARFSSLNLLRELTVLLPIIAEQLL